MKKLDSLFNKNVITILIIVVVFLLAVVFAVDLYIVFKSPAKDTLLTNLFPTPTFDLKELVTRAALTAEANAKSTPPPTITTMPFTPFASELTPSAEIQTATQTAQTPIQPTQTPVLPTPTKVVSIRTPPTTQAATPSANTGADCIPANTPQTGKVLEILDGNTIRVMIGGPVYTVRYIGVATPTNPIAAQAATYTNGKLVYGKEVTLFTDVEDKDAVGRLLRYVKTGNTFVNLEMINKGWGAATDVPPNSSCARVFSAADQSARAGQSGQWSPTLVPPTP